MSFCEYGCGKQSQFVLNNVKRCCSNHWNGCEEKRKKSRIPSKNRGKPGLKHTEETKLKLSKIGRESKHRRLVKSTRFYTMKNGESILLDSSWEEAFSETIG